jgi:hypothetical protein
MGENSMKPGYLSHYPSHNNRFVETGIMGKSIYENKIRRNIMEEKEM